MVNALFLNNHIIRTNTVILLFVGIFVYNNNFIFTLFVHKLSCYLYHEIIIYSRGQYFCRMFKFTLIPTIYYVSNQHKQNSTYFINPVLIPFTSSFFCFGIVRGFCSTSDISDLNVYKKFRSYSSISLIYTFNLSEM